MMCASSGGFCALTGGNQEFSHRGTEAQRGKGRQRFCLLFAVPGCLGARFSEEEMEAKRGVLANQGGKKFVSDELAVIYEIHRDELTNTSFCGGDFEFGNLEPAMLPRWRSGTSGS